MRQWDAFSTMHPTFHFVPVSNMSLCHNPLLTTHSSSLATHRPKYVSFVLLYNKTRKPQADGHAELVSASVRSQGLVKARSEILKQVQDDIWRYLLLLTHFGAANSILMLFRLYCNALRTIVQAASQRYSPAFATVCVAPPAYKAKKTGIYLEIPLIFTNFAV